MKIYKNFDEIRGTFEKLSRKYDENLEKKLVNFKLSICWNLEDNLIHFWENFM